MGVARNNVRTYINTNEDDAGFTFEAWVYPRADSPLARRLFETNTIQSSYRDVRVVADGCSDVKF